MNFFKKKQHIVTRFAPSPTGFMHIGGVRTALFAFLLTRRLQGTFILRIEDTDTERKVEGSVEHIKESLQWLSINWEYGPDRPGPFGSCIQSERLPIYREFAEKLIKKGLAYADPYTQEEIAEFRKQAQDAKRPFLYRMHRPEHTKPWDGSTPLRLRVVEPKRYQWEDMVRGSLEAGEEALDDFVLIKSDGYPTYNFAHIVDDHLMGVTHVFRADEFIASTPRFLSLYDALGIEPPHFVTLPPILREDRTKKLGKRDGAKDILEYRDDGYLPSAMINYLALLGWNPGTDQEIFSMDELIQTFDVSGIQKGGATLSAEKLDWCNREHLKRLPDTAFFEYVQSALPSQIQQLPQYSTERLQRLLPAIRERVSTKKEITESMTEGEYDFAFLAPTPTPEMLKWKNDPDARSAVSRLQKLAEIISTIDEISTPEEVKARIMPYAEEIGKGEVLWPLRVALTGRERSPDPFTVLHIIGSAEAYNRVRHACDTILSA